MSSRNDCRIYVGNLPPDIRTKDVEDLFYRFGKVVFVDLKNRRGEKFRKQTAKPPKLMILLFSQDLHSLLLSLKTIAMPLML